MIVELLAWAAEYGHRVNSRAMMLGAVGRPGTPDSPQLLGPSQFLWLVEGIVRELNPKNDEALDKLYSDAARKRDRARSLKRSAAAQGRSRGSAVDEFVRFALG